MEENLITLLGIESLPDEEKMKVIEQATALIEKRVMLRVMEALSDEDAKQAEQLADKPEAMAELIAAKVPNMADIVAEETEAVKRELVDAAVGQAPPKLG